MKLVPQSAREMARHVDAVGATTDRNAALCYYNVWYTMQRVDSNLVFKHTDLRLVRVLPICMTRNEIAINVRPGLIEPLRHLLWCVRELMPTTESLRCIVCNQHCKLLHFQCTHRVHAACARTLSSCRICDAPARLDRKRHIRWQGARVKFIEGVGKMKQHRSWRTPATGVATDTHM